MEQDIQKRVSEILGKMTLEQKIGQMTQTERMVVSPEEVKAYHLGSVLSGGGSVPGDNTPKDWVEMNQAYWQASMEEDQNHLAIPIIYGVDAIHGHNNVLGATVFPHNIGLGCMRDPDLIERIARVTAKEILATGVEWTFAPTLAVAKNYKWGRTYESYSEDPAIVESYADRFVRGLQGDLGRDSIVACVKHWVGDGATHKGIDQGDTRMSEEELRKVHIRPYLPALRAGTLTVMVSFNSWNGKKCHGHKYLLTDVLKNELGFNGFIISDWDGIDYLSENYREAVKGGVNAGIDMFMVSEKWRDFIGNLTDLVYSGKVPVERIDDAVRRILYVKVKYGLFEKPAPEKRYWSNHKSFGSREHREVAREAVRKSLVLLKNENNALPLNAGEGILVAGKNANDCGHQCGGFTVAWQGISDNKPEGPVSPLAYYGSENAGVIQGTINGGTSIWQAISRVSKKAELSVDGNKADPSRHKVAVVAIGEKPYAEGMGDIRWEEGEIAETTGKIEGLLKVLQPYGHSLVNSRLHPEDLETILKIRKKGIPVICVFIGGRPLVINEELENSDAFISAWLPGSEGDGIADVLFGKFNFQGRLSFTWYKDQEQSEVLFPLDFGLTF